MSALKLSFPVLFLLVPMTLARVLLWAQNSSAAVFPPQEESSIPFLSNRGENDSEKSVLPHWSWQTELVFSGRQELGRNPITAELSLTGTYSWPKTGHSLSAGVLGGTQTLEGAASGYAGLELAGGLGLGVFQPSLTLQALEGTQSLTSLTSTVTLDFEVMENLALGPGFWAGTSSHQGAVTQFLTPGDKTVEIDVHSLGFSLNARFTPSEVLTLRAQVLRETDDLYQVQNSARTKTTPLSQTSTLTAANLGIEWSLVEKLSFEISAEGGVEELPAGSVYSPVLGETLFFSSPTSPFFTGYAAGLIYYF